MTTRSTATFLSLASALGLRDHTRSASPRARSPALAWSTLGVAKKRWLAIFLTLPATASFGESIHWFLDFQGQFPLTDPVTFTPTTADVYHVVVDNPNPVNVYTYSLRITGGPFFVSTASVQRGTDFPQLGPFTVADSFLVANPNAPSGAVNPIGVKDTETELSGTVTVLAADPTNGNAPVDDSARVAIPAGGSAVLAVLSVPAGTFPPIHYDCGIGQAVVGDHSEEILNLCPEPSSALLAAVALVAAATGRRR